MTSVTQYQIDQNHYQGGAIIPSFHNSELWDDLEVVGDLESKTQSSIKSRFNIKVHGNASFLDSISAKEILVGGDLSSDHIYSEGNLFVGGNLHTTGGVRVRGSLVVMGDLIATGSVTAKQIVVLKNLSAKGISPHNLFVGGATNVGNFSLTCLHTPQEDREDHYSFTASITSDGKVRLPSFGVDNAFLWTRRFPIRPNLEYSSDDLDLPMMKTWISNHGFRKTPTAAVYRHGQIMAQCAHHVTSHYLGGILPHLKEGHEFRTLMIRSHLSMDLSSHQFEEYINKYAFGIEPTKNSKLASDLQAGDTIAPIGYAFASKIKRIIPTPELEVINLNGVLVETFGLLAWYPANEEVEIVQCENT